MSEETAINRELYSGPSDVMKPTDGVEAGSISRASIDSEQGTANDVVAVQRTRQLFTYLAELNQRRNPVIKSIARQPWSFWLSDLPIHPTIQRAVYDTQGDLAYNGVVLRVGRANKTAAPSPPDILSEWIKSKWETPEGDVSHIEKIEREVDDETIIEWFSDVEERMAQFDEWRTRWAGWAKTEIPARAALKIFEELYGLYGQIQRDGERQELLLGDGYLAWKRADGEINHPILLQRLQLNFNPEKPEFTLVEAESEVELYTALFTGMSDVDGAEIGRCRAELEQGAYHPLETTATNGFFRRVVAMLAVDGKFDETVSRSTIPVFPRISREPVLFMRARTLGFATAIEGILSSMREATSIPRALSNIVGIESNYHMAIDRDGDSRTTTNSSTSPDILLSKPANNEQIEIASRLERHGCVLVQGPPGTGKTHTIANLIGHLLAQGKSVLVTSQKANALKVVRDQVVEQLQPLCVSVTGSDTESRSQLESSVESIIERLGRSEATQLDAEAEQLASRRKSLIQIITDSRVRLERASFDEYRDIVIAGRAYQPAEAAREVFAKRERDSWITDKISLNTTLSLTVSEIRDLYATTSKISKYEERELNLWIPVTDFLPTPSEFEKQLKQLTNLKLPIIIEYNKFWSADRIDISPKRIENIADGCSEAIDFLKIEGEWAKAAIEAGRKGGSHRNSWDTLLTQIANCHDKAAHQEEINIQFAPTLAIGVSIHEQLLVVDQIVEHLESGKSLSWLVRTAHREWVRMIGLWKIAKLTPVSLEEFKALQFIITLQISREELVNRWSRLISSMGGPDESQLGAQPEYVAYRYLDFINRALNWYKKELDVLQNGLSSIGLDWKSLWQPLRLTSNPHADLDYLQAFLTDTIIPLCKSRMDYLNGLIIQKQLDKFYLQCVESAGDVHAVAVDELIVAIQTRDENRYAIAYDQIGILNSKSIIHKNREALIDRLHKTAPEWACAIRNRSEPHNNDIPPGLPQDAWLWSQLNNELSSRAEVSLGRIQQSILEAESELKNITSNLVDRRSWSAQVKRTTLERRQSLLGWKKTIQRIGSGTGKGVPGLQAEARKLMSQSKDSVPVWIMPLARVVENFDTRTTRFDVVIIDEASQCDVMGLIPCYMADQVVVVGDDEQVSPDAVGQNITLVNQLIAQHLEGIPNSHLYDGKQSIYDLAMQSFGGTICLREHFRCVPDIIQFSNELSYDGKIKPLRDHSTVQTRPFVVPYRVDGIRIGNSNIDEAKTIVSLIRSCIEQPEYANASIGVISLVKEEQAALIESMLQNELPPSVYEKHRILCGIPPSFQGDERDIVFLTMVDSSNGSPQRLKQADLYKKRYNVAASRAKDQLWVVHSLNSEIDLRPGDLRRRLLDYAANPQGKANQLQKDENKTESEFERLVLHSISLRGFEIVPQWKVGGYRIDLVVEGNGKRLAVECDGDRYHYTLEQVSNDMQRQAILERLGWTFVRIRGSDFLRNPELALEPVYNALEKLRIEPTWRHHDAEQDFENIEETVVDRVIRRATEILHRQDLPDNKDEVLIAISDIEGYNVSSGSSVNRTFGYVAPANADIDKPSQAVTQISTHALNILPYKRYPMPKIGPSSDFYRLAHENSPELTRLLVEIVSTEGPIHREEATRRLVSGWSMGKAGTNLVLSVDAIARRAQTNGQMKIINGFFWPIEIDHGLVRGPSEDGYIRPIDEIAIEEIAEACALVITQRYECNVASLKIALARLFGYQKTGRNVATRLEDGINLCREQGRIDINGELVSQTLISSFTGSLL
ncbi:MAG: DUF3320 domain-containing protein [Capsulimonas sp.]|uniref:DUF3320 domain-containing protein n=1 Tax=Capsulimonas sp. TaxID=2494211 RepID=UPI0032663E27